MLTRGAPEGSSDSGTVVREVAVAIREGLHARPVMRFVDHASKFQSKITVQNATRKGDIVDGKSAMQMMLLEATVGNVLRISAIGPDAALAVDSLVALVETGFDLEGPKAAV
ncbi:MAG: HPr family phosphocarrier protein [Planctomycetes bacterium]|nr:HPr family phosphocarrier protein [Planctomycetota bacterium]MBI3835220.1 HPr family phosphocarrier protein [Planctomycetota bacterium]